MTTTKNREHALGVSPPLTGYVFEHAQGWLDKIPVELLTTTGQPAHFLTRVRPTRRIPAALAYQGNASLADGY